MKTLAKYMLDELLERECVDDVASRMDGALRVVLTEGLPATRILDVATRDDVAMIVLGSHGRSGAARMMLGSVVDEVSRQSKVPVTIVRSTWTGWQSSPLEEEGEKQAVAQAAVAV
jgi:nucleotide-binding universal stress UspA family protein